jgi:DNA invertase Pin-like site-specific DNA recombinase
LKGQRIGYTRVSTEIQNTELQLAGVEVDRTFTDKRSGKDRQRPKLKEAMEFCRDGDTLVVHSMDRLARNLRDLLTIVGELVDRGVAVEFVKEKQRFGSEKDKQAKLMLQMLGAFAEFEREMILERQREGIAIAKKKGVYKGRKPMLNPERAEQLRQMVKAGEMTKTAIAAEFGISRETLYTYLQ